MSKQFNSYNKKLGMSENVHEKYIGTIFSRQQTGFIESLEIPLNGRVTKVEQRRRSINSDNVEHRLRGLKQDDFDRCIKFGRDELLFLKREAIERLSHETRYSEAELQNLKTIYTYFAKAHIGLNLESFSILFGHLSNIHGHPFIEDIFAFFDKDEDGLVDFDEFIKGLDIVERGNFDQKCAYCFETYDSFGLHVLDIYTLRQLLKRSFSEVIINLEKVLSRLSSLGNGTSMSWEEFADNYLNALKQYMPTALDRMELHKNLVNQLEFRYGFTLENLEQLWNEYYPKIGQPVSMDRLQLAVSY